MADRGATMQFASLKSADLSYANFDDTDLWAADLTDAYVSKAVFLGTGPPTHGFSANQPNFESL